MTLDEVIVALTLKNLELEAELERANGLREVAEEDRNQLNSYLENIAVALAYTGHYGNLARVATEKI